MVIDCITFNNEKELFDLRYNILKDVVDEFIVVEFDKTFSGKDKPWYFDKIAKNYSYKENGEWRSKVKPHFIYESSYSKYKDLANNSPNTVGAEHWKREFMQKESIKDCLTHLDDEDIVFISDCDEIWDSSALKFELVNKLKLKVYTYYLNNRSNEEFWGTLVAKYKDIKNECLNHLRTNARKTQSEFGWHFTSMAKSLKQKLQDSYTNEDYATEEILDNLDDNIKNDRDFLGRGFTYTTDESEWPDYLKKNKEKYRHLLK